VVERSRIGFLLPLGFLWRLLSIEKAARMGGMFNRATLDSHILTGVRSSWRKRTVEAPH